MTVLIASELSDADLALLTRPEPPALQLGGLRMLARASGVAAGRPDRPSAATRHGGTAVTASNDAVPFARIHGVPRGWPGVSPDGPCALRASRLRWVGTVPAPPIRTHR